VLPTILYGADADSGLGLGHIAHAVHLHHELRQRSMARVLPIGRYGDGSAAMFQREGIEYIEQDRADAPTLIEKARAVGADVVGFNLAKHQLDEAEPVFHAVNEAGLRQIHFDNPVQGQAYADLVINALPHVDWGMDLAAHPAAYEGLEYLLLDPEFAQVRPRVRGDEVRTVLISMGGGDASNLTGRVMAALESAGYTGEAEVVVGAANPHAEAIAAQADVVSYEVRLHRHLPTLAETAERADLAFSALGVTTYEFASVGLPVAILAGTELNTRVAEIYTRHGAAVSLGYYRDLSESDLASAVASVLGDSAARETMSRRGPELVDGKGADRVCDLIGELLEKVGDD